MITVLRVLLAVVGGWFLILDFVAYAKQKLTDSIGMLWALVSVALIIIAAVPGKLTAGGEWMLLLLFFICLLLLFLLFKVCKAVSVLTMKNQELAMQVSLLNQENERILHELGILNNDEKNTVRN